MFDILLYMEIKTLNLNFKRIYLDFVIKQELIDGNEHITQTNTLI